MTKKIVINQNPNHHSQTLNYNCHGPSHLHKQLLQYSRNSGRICTLVCISFLTCSRNTWSNCILSGNYILIARLFLWDKFVEIPGLDAVRPGVPPASQKWNAHKRANAARIARILKKLLMEMGRAMTVLVQSLRVKIRIWVYYNFFSQLRLS